jgi:5-methylcytosine-specific restriction endonuclease McrA
VLNINAKDLKMYPYRLCMDTTRIHNCKELEKELSEYKLWANMIPSFSFSRNLRSVFSRQEWDLIREATHEKDEHRCAICGKEKWLEVHEDWAFDYENILQRLTDINAICFYCHRNKHLGHSNLMALHSQLDSEKLKEHWAKINGVNIESFDNYEIKCFRLWHLRNNFRWNIVDHTGKVIQETELIDILKFVSELSKKK